MARDIYGSPAEWRARSDECKRKAHFRCECCGRGPDSFLWGLWGRQLNAHHIWRGKRSHLVCLCRACHMGVVHRFDRISPLPLVFDTYIAIWTFKIVRLVLVLGLIAFAIYLYL